MNNRFFFAFAVVALLCAAPVFGQSANALPCFVSQVDRNLFNPGESVAVFGIPSGNGNCQNEHIGSSGIELGINYRLDVWNPEKGDWDFVRYDETSLLLDGRQTRTKMVSYAGLPAGHYAVTSTDGAGFLESIYFDVAGAGAARPQTVCVGNCGKQFNGDGRRPYMRSASIVIGGTMYFRALMSHSARGYLYQVRPDRTEVVPVSFDFVSPADSSAFVNQPAIRGGGLDLPWVQVQLPPNSLSAAYPVYASITADGGGMTANGIVYDPNDPAREMSNGFAAASK
ncbi:MAG: hypothetical protein KGJ93_04785 [Patescibacteria group bacterium]|nr:hypothetical protein [Patescibacteria group bacterium]